MHPKRKKRLTLILFMVLGVSTAVGLLMYSLSQNINLFMTPTQIASGEAPVGRTIRAGGLVEPGSVVRDDSGLGVRFVVSDGMSEVTIAYEGILPDLFREGQGIVAMGKLGEDGVFVASEVLAKHDENYMPPEVKDALEKAHQNGKQALEEARY
ncbi:MULTISPECIES: cytochrome c maturation protein CcmE [Oceanospirillaceae]|jgi:cytochrome c-type biogenesis protein CcmE|uniref:cytochrome c maturation protein CcmE n=1 Tax=Oceanospirillaceae TaxID=135620 RepID=UPI001196ED53|nr:MULTISPECIES: cytochrome c maturation protein CcmE [Thalassolituus]MBU2039030.1 cytochrome c maturation protein CcmE [Gammaproteobacteria bacterium]MCA6059581.1 cytochrome c maturation protein CcmE [Thalassolituus sp. ST750PaO-4]MCB2385503.1 cytochrome c maturation protein CcmE [Thalassolituus alkanivorans]MCB2423241.1 cytochrome c maturation protein CcmE [Thalassolituus alkanivorans]TVV43265.1 cytochrome c maturation protein CcmE [Thalassolituus sp. C2-1]